MTTRRLNPQLVKIHRTYSVQEIADRFKVHKNTVHVWIKSGALLTVDKKRPLLVLGTVLADFIKARRLKNKQPCRAGEVYCVRCRTPQKPAGGIADYEPQTTTLGSLVAICPTCDSVIYRRVNLTNIDRVRGNLDITMPKELPQLSESTRPFVNSDFRQPAPEHRNAPPQ